MSEPEYVAAHLQPRLAVATKVFDAEEDRAMSSQQKLSDLSQRRDAIKRELDGIAAVKPESSNAALGDMESALLSELEQIEDRLAHIRRFLGQDGEQQGNAI